MEKHTVFISLGSNLGNRQQSLQSAIDRMAPEVTPLSFSKIYETPPWGYTNQPPFLNQIVKAKTELSPKDLLLKLKKVEGDIGRQPNFRFGPRIIDLDILLYDDVVFKTEDLIIPHLEIEKRAFVLVPLLDIAPDLIHPVLKKSIADLSAEIETSMIKKYHEVMQTGE
ncbi:MAG: 2-amino-4-hydroxy-6-hydroxymethyldihydropteridine diphosphokinase [Anaerolineaceae bacterium]|nr:2-amino-4-hydroxy-6-hydroxymethyldihydropteridine diphosphokinase [Anaerolineaceae bacterium]